MVTVLLPNYNHSKFLNQRIDSILAQTYPDFELIIMDDCSTDNSREVIEPYRNHPKVAQIIYNKTNSGSTYKQWHKGIDIVQSEYTWIAESDDYAHPDFLKKCMEQLETNPDAGYCFARSHFVDSKGEILKDFGLEKLTIPSQDTTPMKWAGRAFVEEYMREETTVYNASMVVFRTEVAKRISSMYEQFRISGDRLFWSEMAFYSPMVIYIPERLNFFRQHDNKVSTSNKPLMQFYTEPVIINHLLTIMLYTSHTDTYFRSIDTSSFSTTLRMLQHDGIDEYLPQSELILRSMFTQNMYRKLKSRMTKQDRRESKRILWEIYGFRGRLLFFIYKQVRPLYRYILQQIKRKELGEHAVEVKLGSFN